MGINTITNPAGALTPVDDFRTGVDAAGGDLALPRRVEYFRANAAVEKGEALMHVAPTQTVPLSVTPMTTAVATGDPWAFVGAAMEDAAAGELVAVCTEGYCVVKIDTSDTAADNNLLLVPDATTGDFATAASAAAGTSVVGKVLGAEIGTTDTAFAYVGWVAIEVAT